jgi:hypothetical protein
MILIQVSVADINGVRNLLLGLVLQENKFQFQFWKSDLVPEYLQWLNCWLTTSYESPGSSLLQRSWFQFHT